MPRRAHRGKRSAAAEFDRAERRTRQRNNELDDFNLLGPTGANTTAEQNSSDQHGPGCRETGVNVIHGTVCTDHSREQAPGEQQLHTEPPQHNAGENGGPVGRG